MANVTASAPAMVRCRCCRERVPAADILGDGTCRGCSEPAPRFEAGLHDGTLTVRDRELGLVVSHQAPWDEAKAAFVESELNSGAASVALFTWVPA